MFAKQIISQNMTENMDLQERHKLSTDVCDTFRTAFIGSKVRFARTSKVLVEFVAQLDGISWTCCKRKGGGFTMWLKYKKHEPRPHHAVLREMVADYTAHVQERILTGENLKPVRNKAVNPSKDLEIFLHDNWVPMSSIFPINIREMSSYTVTGNWIRKYTVETDMSTLRKVLQSKYSHLYSKTNDR